MPSHDERSILGTEDVRRALTRIAHEVLEQNRGANDVVLIGIHTRGVPLANRLSSLVDSFEGIRPPVGRLDIGLYRDDLIGQPKPMVKPTEIPVPIEDKIVVLVDDVLYTGRSIRAAMDALMDFGRARRIQLAVFIDRVHRELPLRADYVGKNLPTSRGEIVKVRLTEIDERDEVTLISDDGRRRMDPAAHGGAK